MQSFDRCLDALQVERKTNQRPQNGGVDSLTCSFRAQGKRGVSVSAGTPGGLKLVA